MKYTEYFFKLDKEINEEEADIITAFLGELEFDSFTNEVNGVRAYIQNELINKEEIDEVLQQLKALYSVKLEVKEMEDINWNETWEKDYEPVVVNERCIIRAPFHKINPKPEFDIIIEPKMAFGTGHHETTALISDMLFSLKLRGLEVCDAGTGSGVLSIIAHKLGAKRIFAYDIDEWSYRNTLENIKINKVSNVEVKQGNVSLIQNRKFDLLIANINRNILLKDVASFSKTLSPKSTLIVSGFYTQDLSIIKKTFEDNHLKLDTFKTKNNWVAASFIKQ